MRERVEKVIDELVRPLVEADGGDVALEALDDSRRPIEVTLRLGGAYRGCPGTPIVVTEVITPLLREALGAPVHVRTVLAAQF